MNKFGKVFGLLIKSFTEVFIFDKKKVVYSILAILFTSVTTYFDVYLSKVVVDNLFDGSFVIFMIALSCLTLLQVSNNLISIKNNINTLKLSNNFSNDCDSKIINDIQNMDLLKKENPEYNGAINYYSFVKAKVFDLYRQFIQVVYKVILMLIGFKLLLEIEFLFIVLAFLFGIINGIFSIRAIKRNVELQKEMQYKTVRYLYLYELLIGIKNQRELTIYNAYDYFKRKWLKEKRNYDEVIFENEVINSKVARHQGNLLILSNVFLFLLFAFLYQENNYTMGDYILVTMAVTLTVSNISELIQEYSKIKENYIHINSINLLDDDQYSIEDNDQVDFTFKNQLDVRNLNFSYANSEKEALKNINFSIRKGETVVILGDNGAGKSTLIKLLTGLYKINDDCIFYDGVPINNIDRNSLYKKINIVFQDYIQYQTTIRDNIGISDLESIENTAKYEESLRKTNLGHLSIDSKVGLVDSGSVNLSGGQWQRLALSRFYFKESAEIAVLDEATSALDPLSEINTFHEILEYSKNKTTIIISHRVGIAMKADKIIVMENNTILEQGTHLELLQNKSKYYEMWNAQQQWYKEGDVSE